jgi:hypothetical protein
MTACYRAVTHPNEPGHIVQADCSTTVEDSTFLFSFHIREHFKDQLWSSLVQNMPTGSLVLMAFRTQLTFADSLFSSQIRVNYVYVTKAMRESVQSICKQWLP